MSLDIVGFFVRNRNDFLFLVAFGLVSDESRPEDFLRERIGNADSLHLPILVAIELLDTVETRGEVPPLACRAGGGMAAAG